MKLGAKFRLTLGLTMGLLAGISLVLIPGFFATPPTTPTISGSNYTVTPSTFTASRGSQSTPSPAPTTSIVTLDSLLILIGTILCPAIALSFLARRWTLRRTRILSTEAQ